MTEYTYSDVIIDPESEEAINLLGNIVFYGYNPKSCINAANENKKSNIGKLIEIKESNTTPFIIENNGHKGFFSAIIPFKMNPGYVPFESTHEFISAYYKANNEIVVNTESMLSGFGMWLRCKENFESNAKPFLACVSEIYDDCITIGKYPDPITFKGLLEYCEFLDGSPCGKEVKDE